MDLDTLLNNARDAVATDSALTAWSNTHYGEDHNVFIDQDIDNPPDETNRINVQIHSPSKRGKEDERTVSYGFGMFITLNDEDLDTGLEDNITEFKATTKLLQFCKLALAAVRTVKPNNSYMAYDMITDTISSFPVFEADVAIEFEQTLVIGEDPLTI
jgi:hypothetical protein